MRLNVIIYQRFPLSHLKPNVLSYAQQRCDAGDGPREPGGDERATGGEVPRARRGEDGGHDGQPADGELGEQPGVHESRCEQGAHRPVTARNAATMARGSGGQPGTWTSTWTTSSTEPATA